MKKVLIPFLFIFSTYVSAQKDTLGIQLSDSTAIGTPDGKLVSKQIGATGGMIVSEDGRVELIFPEGALTANTAISIQPIINLAPNGVGKSYWFEPSGIQFKKPVQIIFHYTDEEAETCPPDLMGLAIQDKTGKWSFINYEDWDSTEKKLTGFIHHFSGASNVFMLRLISAKREVCVTESVRIDVLEFFERFNVSVEAFFRRGQQNHWYVNDHEMGSESLGFLSIYEETANITRTMVTHATYIAPKYLLRNGNPVTVSLKVKILSGSKRGQYRTLTCRILVYDVYKVSVTHAGEYRAAMGNEITDNASFNVWIYPTGIVLNTIENYPPSITRRGRARAGCILNISVGGNEGSLHLTDAFRNYSRSNDYPPEILFEFLSSFEKTLFNFQWICPGVTTDMQPLYAMPLAPEINFIANGTVQTINVTTPVSKYKVIATPYRPHIR